MFELQPHLANGAQRAGDLLAALGVSRGTLKYAYEREATHVLRLGRARATGYAARQNRPGLDADEFPLFRVDEIGAIRPAGTLVATESVWLPDATIIDGLPPEMHDIAPRGFLGRSYAHRHTDLGLPEDANNWSDQHVLNITSHYSRSTAAIQLHQPSTNCRWRTRRPPVETCVTQRLPVHGRL